MKTDAMVIGRLGDMDLAQQARHLKGANESLRQSNAILVEQNKELRALLAKVYGQLPAHPAMCAREGLEVAVRTVEKLVEPYAGEHHEPRD